MRQTRSKTTRNNTPDKSVNNASEIVSQPSANNPNGLKAKRKTKNEQKSKAILPSKCSEMSEKVSFLGNKVKNMQD